MGTQKNEVLPGSPRSHRISEHVSSKHQILHGLPARLHHQQRKGSRDYPAFVSFPPGFFASACSSCSSCSSFIARPRKTELRCRCTRARRDTIRGLSHYGCDDAACPPPQPNKRFCKGGTLAA